MTAIMLAATIIGCGGNGGNTSAPTEVTIEEPAVQTQAEASTEAEPEETEVLTPRGEPLEVPEGMYLSELTGEPISEEIKNQRPITAMVDNEKVAMPHFGLAEADIVYELLNSVGENDMKNNIYTYRITRLMPVVKDWGQIKRLGNIRSARPTNILLSNEWNAVLCHYGGPFYNDDYFAKPYAKHFSSTFTYVTRSQKSWYNAYIVEGDLDSGQNFGAGKVSREYDEHRIEDESHFSFTPYGTVIRLEEEFPDEAVKCSEISLPFTHNKSKLKYNESTETYDYYVYDSIHKDGEDDQVLSFKNLLIQDCTMTILDKNGYLVYNVISSAREGWYVTNGYARKIWWIKPSDTDHTRYYAQNEDGELEEIDINTGKTYIALVPSDSWDKVEITE